MYHPIKPEDLKHGLNYQIKKTNIHDKEVFVEKRVNMDKFFKDENFIIDKKGFLENIRVRDLSEDEIKKKGWMKVKDDYYKFKLGEVEYYLAIHAETKMCNVFFIKVVEHEGKQVPNRGDLFIGFVSDQSDLRMLMKLLGFKR